jgi:type I restriction enzyme R subunit
LMKLVRETEVVKAAVRDQGEVRASTSIKLRPGGGQGGGAQAPARATVHEVISDLVQKFNISEDEALFIKRVITQKSEDLVIRATVHAHRADVVFLKETYRGQVNEGIQVAYQHLGRYEELADPRYREAGGIFDIMAITVINHHLTSAA